MALAVEPGWAATWLPVLAACCLDRWIGDPAGWLHPVQVMGWLIQRLRLLAEPWAGDRPGRLRTAGAVITLLLVGGSALVGWWLEQLAGCLPPLGQPLLLMALASSLAGGSLRRAVLQVLAALPDLEAARGRLAWIVGREVSQLEAPEILRAAAETASENAVDGLFAPLFWMLLGAALRAASGGDLPGPLALAWAFKASSTLDSMLGYRRGRLRWLGTAGARLDDLLTWLPCRLVALSLPIAAGRPRHCLSGLRTALAEGAADPSPNAGVSQAAYAWAAQVQLGGVNRYVDGLRSKPILASGQPGADADAVVRILQLSDRLEVLWLGFSALVVVTAVVASRQAPS
jgi:adenosylcobinamide-phosphate synthase